MSNGFIGPRRPDPTGRYESPWGDIRDVGGIKKNDMPWDIILSIGLSLLGGLFGKDPEEQKREDLQTLLMNLQQAGIKQPYQSPNIGIFDKIVGEALAANMGRYSNWGQPAGQNIDLSFLNEYLANPGANRSVYGSLPGTVRQR